MPLLTIQKEIIAASLEHLIEFPEDKTDFYNYVKQLGNSFAPGFESKDQELVELSKIFNEPQKYLHQLEKMQEGITVAEVKEEIINFVTQKVKNEAKKWDIDFLLLNWDPASTYLTTQPSVKFETMERIVPPPPPEEVPHLYDFPMPGRRFSFRFEPKIQNNICRIALTINIKLNESAVTVIEEERTLSSIIGETILISSLAESYLESEDFAIKVTKIAESIAADHIIQHLKKKHKTSFLSYAAKRILTQDFYFSEILQDRIELKQIAFINEQEYKILTVDYVKKLISRGVPIITLRQLTDGAELLLSQRIYFEAFANKSVSLKDINIPRKIALMFLEPNVINLFTLEIDNPPKPIEVLSCMHVGIYKIIQHVFHFESIKKEKLLFKDLSRLSRFRAEMLIDPKIITLLGCGALSYQQMYSLPIDLYWLISKNGCIFYYLQNNIINIDMLLSLQDHPMFLDESFEGFSEQEMSFAKTQIKNFIELVKHRLLNLSDILCFHKTIKQTKVTELKTNSSYSLLHNQDLLNKSEDCIASRLKKLAINQPYILIDGSLDNIKTIVQDMRKCQIDKDKIILNLVEEGVDRYCQEVFHLFRFLEINNTYLDIDVCVLYSKLLAVRLFAIFENNAFVINNKKDNTLVLQAEIELTAKKLSLDPVILEGRITRSFLLDFAEYLKAKIPHINLQINNKLVCMSELISKTVDETKRKSIKKCFDVWHTTFLNVVKVVGEAPVKVEELSSINRKRKADDKPVELSSKQAKIRSSIFHSSFSTNVNFLNEMRDRLNIVLCTLHYSHKASVEMKF